MKKKITAICLCVALVAIAVVGATLAYYTATKTATAELLSSASSAVDKAAAKGVISKNAANREKARMARELAKAE